jgi:hypothetical protein
MPRQSQRCLSPNILPISATLEPPGRDGETVARRRQQDAEALRYWLTNANRRIADVFWRKLKL